MASPMYGPPKWDRWSKDPHMGFQARQKRQKDDQALYFSHWKEFQDTILVGNPTIETQLKRIALKALVELRRKIPVGDSRNGHMRNDLKIVRLHRTGFSHLWPNDRTGYGIVYAGKNPKGFAARLKQSSYPSKEAYLAAVKQAQSGGGSVPFGPRDSWGWEVAKKLEGER